MIPSIEHIIKKRHHNRRRLRFMALVSTFIGMFFISWAVIETVAELFGDRNWSASLSTLILAGSFILPAVVLWMFDARISRALVPLPKLECPGCRYDLTALRRPTCPECGLSLPAAYVTDPPDPSAP